MTPSPRPAWTRRSARRRRRSRPCSTPNCRPPPGRREPEESEAVRRQPGHRERRGDRRRPGHRPHRNPGEPRCPHQPVAGIREQRRPGVADQRDRFPGAEPLDQVVRPLRFVVLVVRDESRAAFEPGPQFPRHPRVLTREMPDAAQRLHRPRREIPQVPDGRGHDEQHPRRRPSVFARFQGRGTVPGTVALRRCAAPPPTGRWDSKSGPAGGPKVATLPGSGSGVVGRAEARRGARKSVPRR